MEREQRVSRSSLGRLAKTARAAASLGPAVLSARLRGKPGGYDFGCVRSFEPEMVRTLRELADAVRRDHADRIDEALEALGARPQTRPQARDHARTLLRGFFAPLLRPGPHVIEPAAALEARALFRDKRLMLGLALPGELLFLFRLRFGLYSVLTRLGACVDWSALEQELAAQPPALTLSSSTT